jgi:exopolysaccharide biosynthesis polyprenyl glycosylphosphotransferase
MLGRKEELNLQFLQIVDALLLAISFWGAHTFRSLAAASLFVFDQPIGPFKEFQWLLFIILPFGPIILELQGFYANPLQKTIGKSLEQLARTAIGLGILIAACSYFLRLDVPSRAVMPLFLIFAGITLLTRERLTYLRLKGKIQRQDLRDPIILTGTTHDIYQFRHAFTPDQVMEIEIVQEIDLEREGVSALIDALHKHSVSRVVFAGNHSHLRLLEEGIAACEIEGVEAWLVADFIRTSIARPSFDVFGERPMLVFRTTPEISWELLLKGGIDRLGAIVGLIVFALPMICAAIVIRITSPGPIIFRQQRGGKNGRPFTMYKFRTMETDAEMRQSELAAFNQMSGPVFKIEKDPRITPIGNILRRTSLDELPQLFNVLKGEMSLVGPRPLPLYEVEKFETTAQRRRLSMKPGLTCLWQISGRNQISSFSDWVKLDLRYIDNWSLWLDLKILVKTIPVVLFGWGAK